MSFATWLAFVIASGILLLIPGPTVTLIVGYAVAHGRAAAAAMAVGVALGDLAAMTLSLAGLGAILGASAALFTTVKIGGALYLVYLGWKLWNAPVADVAASPPPRSPVSMAVHAFAVTFLNPKSLVFFVAFVPQFVDHAKPYAAQVLVLVATFVGLALANALAYALLAAKARRLLHRPSVRRAVNRVGGGILMGAGAVAATARGP